MARSGIVAAQSVGIIGAGLAALRTAESLRSNQFTGPITVIGEEPEMPYNRPPLSKEALRGGIERDALLFPVKAPDVDWLTGTAATACDLEQRRVTLDDGSEMAFDALVIATGIRPRRLPIPGPNDGRYVLRTLADAAALRAALQPDARLVILGAGFIGCEVAATARSLGCEVDIVALDDVPMGAALGTDLGRALQRRHERNGVHFHLGRTVQAFLGDNQVSGVMLDDGTQFAADLVLEAVGSIPNTDWLAGNDIDISDGVLTNEFLAVGDRPVFAVGDIARHPNALFDTQPRRVEHWNMATETGKVAGANLAALLNGGTNAAMRPFAALPSFWSDQYDAGLQAFGLPHLGDDIRVVDGSPDGDVIVEYHRDGLVGVVGVNRTPDLIPYRRQLLDRATT